METIRYYQSQNFHRRILNEIQFIFKDISSLYELTPKLIADFASYLLKAFNLIAYSSVINQNHEYYWLNMKLIFKPFPKGAYTNNTGYMERLYNVWIINILPKMVAKKLRNHFKLICILPRKGL